VRLHAGSDRPKRTPNILRSSRLSLDLPPADRESFWPDDLLEKSDAHMRRVRQMLDGVGVSIHFHGHHHLRYDDEVVAEHGSVEVRGLGDNRTPIEQLSLLVDETGRPIHDV
jgi:hypothetical protein